MKSKSKENLAVLLKDEKFSLKTNALIGRVLEYHEKTIDKKSNHIKQLPCIKNKDKLSNESRASNDFDKR
jgi:hypothetical protein